MKARIVGWSAALALTLAACAPQAALAENVANASNASNADSKASDAKSTTTASTSGSALRFAWQRDGAGARLWTLDPASDTAAQGSGEPLPATLETPLGSVWKLFVYAYLVDRQIAAPDYQCDGHDREEVYCCMTGGHIDRDRALVQSCGLFFEPRRLELDPAGWRQYWRARKAPAWLLDLYALRPDRRVRVSELLAALQAVPARARDDTASTLVSVVTSGRGEGTVSLYGSLLRAKTWTMPDPANPGGYEGGAAGWLADGTPVWLGGRGGSVRVLAAAAPRIAPLIAQSAVPDDRACVVVDMFSRYPIRNVFATRAGGRPVQPGLLDGAYNVSFENGNTLPIESHGELLLDRDDTGKPRIVGRFGMNDYVARVVEREGDTAEPQAARALAVAARSYLVQHAGRDRGCYRIDDSSRTQRVLPRAPRVASRNAADFTDGLVLAGVPVQFHHDKAAPGQMSWLDARAAAQRGQSFDAILARTWPEATLTSFASPLAGDCEPVMGARDWLRRETPKWDRRLASEAGYEEPEIPAVCEVVSGRPYADAGRNRVYIRRLSSDDDRIALAHEYLHLAFAHHPRGQDETFIEQTARKLILTGS
ncbi:uncharacterized protein YfaQ (DUF2300 family) [Paraburkholderia tropica]|uniref:DUF2300 domain-containing protein n=1 Tax=Paraburkholderia tropica TaxID=92647 RepID=UPI001845FAEB|nr:uncharacterized protein YfaQ (DUF2300 family) [Paraburkholderia tropica]MBB6324113.1 uncharacterized protein YfaQ (DUF2300 family) [Paraburkholderia tropica]